MSRPVAVNRQPLQAHGMERPLRPASQRDSETFVRALLGRVSCVEDRRDRVDELLCV